MPACLVKLSVAYTAEGDVDEELPRPQIWDGKHRKPQGLAKFEKDGGLCPGPPAHRGAPILTRYASSAMIDKLS